MIHLTTDFLSVYIMYDALALNVERLFFMEIWRRTRECEEWDSMFIQRQEKNIFTDNNTANTLYKII